MKHSLFKWKKELQACVNNASALRMSAVMVGLLLAMVLVADTLIVYFMHGAFITRSPIMTASSKLQLIALLFSRASAGFMYPFIFLTILTKLNYINAHLSSTWISEIVPFDQFDGEHRFYGRVIYMSAIDHVIMHTIRLSLQGRLMLILTHPTGWSGVVASMALGCVVLPFTYPRLHTWLGFEIRKGLHYCSMIFIGIMAFHNAPRTMYIFFGLLGFSLIIDEKQENGLFYIMSVGDWTRRLYDVSHYSSRHPVMWINGPHPSPFENSANHFACLIIVASGVGVTPAISLIERFHSTREVYLIWICREAASIHLFGTMISKVQSKVFYTGKAEDLDSSSSQSQECANPISKLIGVQVDIDIEDFPLLYDTFSLQSGRPSIRKELELLIQECSTSAISRVPTTTTILPKNTIKVLYCGASTNLKGEICAECTIQGVSFSYEFFQAW